MRIGGGANCSGRAYHQGKNRSRHKVGSSSAQSSRRAIAVADQKPAAEIGRRKVFAEGRNASGCGNGGGVAHAGKHVGGGQIIPEKIRFRPGGNGGGSLRSDQAPVGSPDFSVVGGDGSGGCREEAHRGATAR